MVATLSGSGWGYSISNRRTICTDPTRHNGSNLGRKVGNESDLVHMRARYSDPSVGGDKCRQGTNWFTGCKNDPIPYGMNAVKAASISLVFFHALLVTALAIGAFAGLKGGRDGFISPVD